MYKTRCGLIIQKKKKQEKQKKKKKNKDKHPLAEFQHGKKANVERKRGQKKNNEESQQLRYETDES